MMADAPTTGGYPKIATVVSVDLALLAQLTPGIGRVRFQAVSLEEAQRL
jgi:allophanate hydrolase subunit 2